MMERLYESIFPREMSLYRELCTTAAVFSLAFLLTHVLLRLSRRERGAGNLPPGLLSLPILGSAPFISRDRAHIFFMEKARNLGPVFTFNFPNRVAVVINGREMIYEAFVNQHLAFAMRPHSFSNKLLNPERKGIVDHPYDSEFRRYHKLYLNILRKFGFGKGIMENRIQVEVEDLLVNIRKLNGKAFCADHLVARSVSNVMASIIFGERFDHSSPVLADLIERTRKFLSLSRDRVIVDFCPILRHFPPFRCRLNRVIEVQGAIPKHMGNKVDAGLQGELSESFISECLQLEGPGFDRDQLLFTLRDLYIAGTETTTVALQWALIFLANNQDIQQRLHTEIDSVVPMNRLPALDDRRKLLFTEAVILELLRIKTVLPFGLPHETRKNTHLNGYLIPKGTMVLANLYSAHMDPSVWKDPHTFNPERFLGADGKVTNRETVVSFSMGSRSCFGEILAQQELFLFLTGLVQHFQILPPDGQSTVEYNERIAITLVPKDYEVRLLPRSN